ncbi:MAG TPA: hypothetical protein VFI84_03250 [Candidatus Saccharimonadales bacterium]|nr:hypothetical protein [Candidatus Saccharimonadales bacterium]
MELPRWFTHPNRPWPEMDDQENLADLIERRPDLALRQGMIPVQAMVEIKLAETAENTMQN